MNGLAHFNIFIAAAIYVLNLKISYFKTSIVVKSANIMETKKQNKKYCKISACANSSGTLDQNVHMFRCVE